MTAKEKEDTEKGGKKRGRRRLQKRKRKLTSGQNPLVINSPKLQNLRQRYASSVLTFIFWAFWFYLLLPLLSLFAWLFGYKVFYDNMIRLGGIEGLWYLLSDYVLVLCSMAIVFFGWAYYNSARFRNQGRRHKTWKVTVDNLGARFNLSEDDLLICKTSRWLMVYFDEGGNICSVQPPARVLKSTESGEKAN